VALDRDKRMANLKAELIHIYISPAGEFHFLVRGKPPEAAAGGGMALPVDQRIILPPAAAKRLALVMEAAVEDYEAEFGPAPEPGEVRSPATERRRIIDSVQGDKARLLIDRIDGIGVHYGFEQSFKMLPGTLLDNRFLAGFHREAAGEGLEGKLDGLCRAVGMPVSQRQEFLRGLPESNIVLFGFEEGEGSSLYKAYLEYGAAFRRVIRESPDDPGSFVIHRGFKWDAGDSARHTTARYVCHPSWSVERILRRLSESFYGGTRSPVFGIVKGIVETATGRMRPEEHLYVEVEEEGNPRVSFDLNLYRANLLLGELYPFLIAMCRHLSIDEETFLRAYEPAKKLIFGHVSGGTDRRGRDFLTVYYGVKGSSRRGPGGP